jgi:hypothetical protein
VTSALGEIEGLSGLRVEVGAAEFAAEDPEVYEEATRAVQALGFEVTSPPASGA